MIDDQTFQAIRRGPSSSSNQERLLPSSSAVTFGITRSEISFTTGKETVQRLREKESISHDYNHNLIHLPKQSEGTVAQMSSSLSELRCDFDNKRVEEPLNSFSSGDRLKLSAEGKSQNILRLPATHQGSGGLTESFPECSVQPSSAISKKNDTQATDCRDMKLPFTSFRQPGFYQPNRVNLHSTGQHAVNENGRKKERSYVFNSIPQTGSRFHVADSNRKRSYDSKTLSNCNNNQNGSSKNSESDNSVRRLSNSKDPDATVAINESYSCWRKPLIDQILITDVTANFVTVTVKECLTDKGFFRRR